MPQTNQRTNIPPLSEIVKNDDVGEVLDLAPSLSLSEIVIAAVRPLGSPRPQGELAEFSDAIKQRIRELEAARNNIRRDIVAGLNFPQGLRRVEIADYFDKYGFLVSEHVMPKGMEGLVDTAVLKEVREYREAMKSYLSSGGRTPPNVNELKRLEQTPLNLVYYYNSRHTGREPYLVCCKTKANWRIASKIPYSMISGYRDREKAVEGSSFKRRLRLEDGIVRDGVGLQFITLTPEVIAQVKGFMFQSDNIEVLVGKKGEEVEEYGTEGPYKAIHMEALWNPREKGSQLFNPHIDPVEVILMEFPYFMGANFGQNSYWRRMMAQQSGIVHKHFKNGRRDMDRFTSAELTWKQMVERRIMEVLPYEKPINGGYKR